MVKETKNQDYLNVIKFINAYGDNIFEINKKSKQNLLKKKELLILFLLQPIKAKGLGVWTSYYGWWFYYKKS